MTQDQARQVHASLLQSFHQSLGQPVESRWSWLMAAHVVGQRDISAHWNTHTAMLCFAIQTRDYPEAMGQLFRLALVPLGHLSGRLPLGNTGRVTVSAFVPMKVDPQLKILINAARHRVRRTPPSRAAWKSGQ